MKQLQQVLQYSSTERSQYIAQYGEQLFNNMLSVIGVADDELRDKINYRLFIELLSEDLIPHTTLRLLAQQLVTTEYLYKGIGQVESDDVFTRSFAALWLTGILYADKQLQFLTEEQAQQTMEQALNYLGKERDVRGFVHDKGWAHSVAHGADLAAAIIAHRFAKVEYSPIILQNIKTVFWKGRVFTDDEDERVVAIFESLIQQQFPEDVLVEWMEQLFEQLQFELYQNGYTPQFFHARTNVLQFAKTLYFTLKFSNRYEKLRGVTSIFISKWMKLQ